MIAAAGVELYHVAPVRARASILEHGLDSNRWPGGFAGVYLWPTIELAAQYSAAGMALPADAIERRVPAWWIAQVLGAGEQDVWAVDVAGLELRPGGPYSTHPRELWIPDRTIEPTRLRLVEL